MNHRLAHLAAHLDPSQHSRPNDRHGIFLSGRDVVADAPTVPSPPRMLVPPSAGTISGGLAAFRTLHTGTRPLALGYERKRPIVLDLRQETYESDRSKVYPATTLMIIRHVFHRAHELEALNIHLKYITHLGDCYIMFRLRAGLLPFSTINNTHWIRYLMMHAVGREDVEQAGEGEFRLLIHSDLDGKLEYTCNVLYIHDGIKLTLAPLAG
eukprot:gnl/Spiro4/14831_TR7996_c0_g1_i1.p1 gnl/Spiro4/14831_TR7996_c0_g1~~gnl/Spiro4/14831_TR7996_c0_g1_i1.p1  ORF type:complete len:211 (+),score=28.91 gnl/Spiro4/14831_TR7996_c0_g1_i1:61-693(+)